jgi:hypothetical protein
MNLPKVVSDLVKTQNKFDSLAYANCFSETAVVYDEGKAYKGRKEIEHWIADANEKYEATMQPLSFDETETILKVEVSGKFAGSPIVLSYHLEISDDLIKLLKIKG